MLVYLILPDGVVVMNDDFGYLRSVIGTLQRGRPWTDDWLEPWSAGLSVLSALVYRSTGSFAFAVHGTLAGCAAAAFYATGSLLRARGYSNGATVFTAVLCLTSPTLLWKEVEFTGVALYVPCLLLALCAAERRRWGWFFACWALAIATRQSAITWALLPATELWRLGREQTSRRLMELAPAAAVLLAGLGLFLLLSRGMNKSHAQQMITDHAFDHISIWTAFGLGGAAFLGAVGLGAVARAGQTGFGAANNRRILPAIMVGIPIMFFDLRNWVGLEHTLITDTAGWLYTKIVILLAVFGWADAHTAVRRHHLIYAMGSMVLIGLRSQIWDYYLLDVAVFGFFGLTSVAIADDTARTAPSPLARWKQAGAVGLSGFHLLFLGQTKCALDRTRGLCLVHETALRSGRIEPSELCSAPFGFKGWYLYPWYIAHEGQAAKNIASFGCYLRPRAIGIGRTYSSVLHIFPGLQDRPPPPDSEIVASNLNRFVLIFKAECFLLRFPALDRMPLPVTLPSEYQPPRFPLNDDEWRALIDEPADQIIAGSSR